MTLPLSKLIASDLVVSQSGTNAVLTYKNQERSIMSLFWTCYYNLEEGKHTVVVVNDKDDLEQINYHISKYTLSQLCLILNDGRLLESSYWKEKFRDDDQRKNASLQQVKDHERARLALEDLLTQMNLDASKLRVPQLGSLSLAQINDKLFLGSQSSSSQTSLVLKPPYDYGVYRAKKEMLIEAQKLHKEKFFYLDNHNPFLKSTLLALGSKEIQIQLRELESRINSILKGYEEIEQRVCSSYETGQTDGLDQIKIKLSELRSMYHSQSEITETDLIKQTFHQKALFEALDITADPPTEAAGLKMGMARIEEAIAEKIVAQQAETQKLSSAFLDKLTAANTDYPQLAELIKATNVIFQEVKALELFSENPCPKSVAFTYQKNNLLQLKDKLAYGQFFLIDNEGYIDWLEFEQQLSTEDLAVIQHLSKQEQFWGEGYQQLFLENYVNFSKFNLSSVQKKDSELDKLLHAYINLRHIGIVKKNATSKAEHLDINTDSWEAFLDESGTQIMERYPLLIIDAEFYDKYSERLINATDNLIFLNDIPRKIYQEDWLKNTFLGSTALFMEQVKNRIPSLRDCEIIEVEKKNYNINRHFDSLTISELNRAARYLGQEMKSISPDFKIYQTKGASIISFWSDAKNATLLSYLEPYSVKEIVSDSQEFNLMPGVLADTSTQNYVLLEDNLFAMNSHSSIVRQHRIKDELKTAGIAVLSVDNYEILLKGKQAFHKVFRSIKIEAGQQAAAMV